MKTNLMLNATIFTLLLQNEGDILFLIFRRREKKQLEKACTSQLNNNLHLDFFFKEIDFHSNKHAIFSERF